MSQIDYLVAECGRWIPLMMPYGRALALDHAAAECKFTAKPGILNLGFNPGGCYTCDAPGSTGPASGDDLEELCRSACLADPECKAYETSQRAVDRFYELTNPTGQPLNCCLEYSAIKDFQNQITWSCEKVGEGWVDTRDGHDCGNCGKEAKCWTTTELSGDCTEARAAARIAPSSCTYAIPADGSWGIQWGIQTTPEDIESLKSHTDDGCLVEGAAGRSDSAERTHLALDYAASQCTVAAEDVLVEEDAKTYSVTFALTAGGDVSDYSRSTQAAMKNDIASAAGVSADLVSVTISAASVKVNESRLGARARDRV